MTLHDNLQDAEAAHERTAERSTLAALLRTAWQEYERDYAGYFAGAMVYYALISLVPLVLLLLATLGWFLRLSDSASELKSRVLETVETNFGDELRASIEYLFMRLQEGSGLALAISLGGLLFTASVLFRHLRITFRAIWKHAPPLASGSVRGAMRETLLERAVAFGMVLAGAPLLLAALAALAVVHWVGRLFGDVPLLGQIIAWLIALSSPLVMAPLIFGLLLKFLPPVRLRWRDVWLAAVLCAAAWMVGAELLSLYIVFFGDSRSAYGALGGVLIIMLWINATGKMLFYGAELCKVVAESASREGVAASAA